MSPQRSNNPRKSAATHCSGWPRQGSHHLDRLIEERVVGTDVEQRLVAAYLIGFSVDTSNGYLSAKACAKPVAGHVNATLKEQMSLRAAWRHLCEPLTWTTDTVLAGHEANLGSVTFGALGDIEPGVADAMCQNGQLIVKKYVHPPRLCPLAKATTIHTTTVLPHESASERAGASRCLSDQSGGDREHRELIAERDHSLGLLLLHG